MDWWHWLILAILAVFAMFRTMAFVGARLQTGRAIEAFVIGVKAPQAAQELAWWHMDGKRYMVAAGYTMGMRYSKEDVEAKYLPAEQLLEIGRNICTVDTVTKLGQQLETLPQYRNRESNAAQ